MQTSDENKENDKLWVANWLQILQINIIRIIWKTFRRITNEILELKG